MRSTRGRHPSVSSGTEADAAGTVSAPPTAEELQAAAKTAERALLDAGLDAATSALAAKEGMRAVAEAGRGSVESAREKGEEDGVEEKEEEAGAAAPLAGGDDDDADEVSLLSTLLPRGSIARRACVCARACVRVCVCARACVCVLSFLLLRRALAQVGGLGGP